MPEGNCAIWGTDATIIPGTRDGIDIESPRAGGRYFISRSAAAVLAHQDEALKVKLTSWLIEQRRLGVPCPEISTYTLDEVAARHSPTVHERADALLRYLSAKSEVLGTVVSFYALDNTKKPVSINELLAWTSSRQTSEVVTLAEYCSEEGWIEHRSVERTSKSGNDVHKLMLRPPGYARLAQLDATSTSSMQAFVAMWFDDSMTEAYEKGIAPAIRHAGYEPLRIDGKEHNNKIDDEIIAEVRRSRFVVADFTQGTSGARGGVYYEAGFAHGLDIPVIFTCREDAIDAVHFDTRQYNHIVWSTPDELCSRLSQRISATIGDGPLRSD